MAELVLLCDDGRKGGTIHLVTDHPTYQLPDNVRSRIESCSVKKKIRTDCFRRSTRRMIMGHRVLITFRPGRDWQPAQHPTLREAVMDMCHRLLPPDAVVASDTSAATAILAPA